MHHAKKIAKRGLSLVLTLAMLLSLVSFSAFAAEPAKSASKANLILSKYGDALSAAEKEMARKLIVGEYTYAAPGSLNEDNLVVINKEEKTVVVNPYTDSQSKAWDIVKAVLRVAGEEDVEIDLSTGVIPVADGVPYSVVATYRYTEDLSAEADVLAAALRAPAAVANGLNAIYKLDDKVLPSMRTLTDNLEKLNQIVHDGLPIKEGSSTKIIIDDADLRAEVEKLVAQTEANEGKLTMVALVEAGVTQANLLAQGEAIAAEVDNLKGIVDAILATKGWQDLLDAVGGVSASSATEALLTANDMLVKMQSNLAGIGSDWALDEGVKNVLTSTGVDLTTDALALGGGNTVPAITIEADLTVVEATVEASVGQHTVTVKFSADVVLFDPDTKTNSTVNTDDIESAVIHPTEFKFPEGSEKAAMLTEIDASGKETAAKELWADPAQTFLFDETKYDRTVVEDLPANLEANANYTVKFVPKTFTYEITGDDPEAAVEVPYGTTIVLPEDTKPNKAYDYVINGDEYMQGETFVITENVVIERTEGAAYEVYELDELTAKAVNTGLSDESKAVLNNPAVKTDSVKLRIPSDDNNLVTVAFDGSAYTVTAKRYNSKLSGYWEAATAVALNADDEVLETKPFEGNTCVFNRTDVDKIEVIYKLEVANAKVGGKIEETVNLPAQLKADMEAQEAALSNLTTAQMMNDLDLFKGKLDEIKTAVETYEDKFGDGIYDKFKDLLANCVAADGSLIIRNSMESFQEQGMAYYYKNAATINAQLARLTENLDPISKDDGVKQLMIDKGYETYQTRMNNIVAALAAANDGLAAAPMSDKILSSSSSIDDLVEALKADGIAAVAAPAYLELNETLNGTVPGRNSIKVTVTVKNVEGETVNTATKTFTYPTGAASGTKPAEFIETKLNDFLGADADLYEVTQDAIPATVDENVTVNATATPKWFEVQFVDEEGTVIRTERVALGKQAVDLPASEEEGVRYDYYVNGVQQTDTTYTFSKDELRAGGLQVVRKSVNIAKQEKLPGLVDKLNKAQKDKGMTTSVGGSTTPVATFMLVEKPDGKQVLVLRITPSGAVKKTEVYGEIAKNIVTSGLYIEIEGETFLAESKLYPQSAVDMLLNSGFGMERLINGNGNAKHMAIKDNGDINEMELEGAISPYLTVVPYEPTIYGGYLLESKLKIGTDASSAEEVEFYVTMEDFDQRTSDLKTLKSNIKKLGGYFDVSGIDGAARLTLKTETAYKAYLATAVAASYANVQDLYNMDHQAFIEFLFTFVQKLIEDEDIKLSTYINTAGEVGITINLQKYENYFEYLRKAAKELINNSEPDGKSADTAENLYTWNFTYDLTRLINKLLDKAGLADDPDIANAVAEKILSYAVAVKLPETEYVAIVIVPEANSKRSIVSFPATGAALQATLDENGIRAAVILLKDVDENIQIKKSVVLDLNGKNLGGLEVVGSPTQVVVVDSTIDNRGSIARVSGGSMLKITGGTYASDISAYLPNDYIQDGSGKVMNKLFELTLEGDNIIVNLDTDRITLYGIPSVKAMAVELAFDLAMNFYGAAKLTVNGNELYDMKVADIGTWYNGVDEDDVNDLIDCLNMPGINAFAQEILDDALDFAAIADNADGDLAQFDYVFNTWTIDIHKADNADRLALDVLSNPDNTKTGSIIFRFKSDGSYDLTDYGSSKEEVVDFLRTIDGVTKVKEATISIEKPIYDNRTLQLQGSGSTEFYFDLSEDPGYAMGFAVIFAAGGASNKQDLIDGIQEFIDTNYRNHTKLKAALEAVPNTEALAAFAELSRADGEHVFADLVEELGLTGVIPEDTIKLGRTYRAMLVTFGTGVRKSGVTGNGALVGSYETSEYGEYSMQKGRSITRSKDIRRWTIEATGVVDNAKLTIKLFNEMTPDPIIVTATVDTTNEDILAAKVIDIPPESVSEADGTSEYGLIYVDLVSDREVNYIPYVGFISVADLEAALDFELENADTYELTWDYTCMLLGDGSAADFEVVPTGARITVKAWDSAFGDSVYATATYYIINLGDTNCNGRIDAGDATLMAKHYKAESDEGKLTGFALLAADVNQTSSLIYDDPVDPGDAVKNQVKYKNAARYIEIGSALAP